jgi:serine/threonine protein kinase
MGSVYVAHDPVLGRMVAIKVFLSDLDLPDAVARFTREARSAAALNHTNIVTIHDYGEFSSQPYIVMEYVQGETLTEIIRRKAPVAIAQKLRWLEELSAGVAYAHSFGVIHRDIKPTNLMVDRSGRLKILDFGIARMLGTLASNATALIGTPGYMAPEQILGGTIDFRSDLFSIGVVSYELLSYTEAFPGETLPAITHRILSQDPLPLPQLVADIDPQLVAVVERSLKKSAEERFSDAEALRGAISRLRREAENDNRMVAGAPTLISPTPMPGFKRGTDSQRQTRREPVGVAELTPPPDLHRTNRDELLRRRTMQIETSLAHSRELLTRGELDAALEACLQALTIDDAHVAAMELERTIQSAMALRNGSALTQTLEEQIDETAAPTIVAKPRSNSTTVAPPSISAAAVVGKLRTVFEPTAALLGAVRAALSATSKRQRTIALWTSVSVGLLAVVVAIAFVFRHMSPALGTTVVEAIPWATISEIETNDGTRITVPLMASTPIALDLRPGTYKVRLIGPPPESETRLVIVQVQEGRVTVAAPQQFRTLTPEEYFEPYLDSSISSLPSPETASASEAITPPASTVGGASGTIPSNAIGRGTTP